MHLWFRLLLSRQMAGVIPHLSHGSLFHQIPEDYGLPEHCIHWQLSSSKGRCVQNDGQQEAWEWEFKKLDPLGLT